MVNQAKIGGERKCLENAKFAVVGIDQEIAQGNQCYRWGLGASSKNEPVLVMSREKKKDCPEEMKNSDLAQCSYLLSWQNCYRNFDLAAPESMAHPAKAGWGLAFRILEHLGELGLLKEGDTILDSMAGTGRFLLAACAGGYRVIAVELEGKFCQMLRENKAYAEKKLGHPIELTIIQGDSRHLSDLLQERGLIQIVSPPYVSGGHHNGTFNTWGGKLSGNKGNAYDATKEGGYSDNPANIGNLPDRIVQVTSPPYLAAEKGGGISALMRGQGHYRLTTSLPGNCYQPSEHGNSEGQNGNEKEELYLDAMRQIYAESLKVCGVMVVVVKDPTRNGKIRELGKSTIALMQSVGWQIVCVHHSILFVEQEQGHLFEGSRKKVRGRMSFFKRLQWQKGTSPVANFEHVIFAVNPQRNTGLCQVMSPPYAGNVGHGGEPTAIDFQKKIGGDQAVYSTTPGQIGNLKD